MLEKKRSVDYALTVTLKPILYKYTPPEQYRHTIAELNKILKDEEFNFVIVPEITPKNDNVHYHCVLNREISGKYKTKNFVYHIRNLFRCTKSFGFIMVKECDNYFGWKEYMKKDLDKTIDYCDLHKECYKETITNEFLEYELGVKSLKLYQ